MISAADAGHVCSDDPYEAEIHMDTPDPLDAMLDNSAPKGVTLTPDLQRDLAVMNRAAGREKSPKQTALRGVPRLAVGIGFALALTGAAGAAAAAGLFYWEPWAENPDVTYAFTLPSGRECEARMLFHEGGPNENWDGFVESMKTAKADPAVVERWATEIRDEGSVIVINADGTLEDVPPGTEPQTEDGTYAAANWVAIKEAIRPLTQKADLELLWTSQDQILCETVTP
jgi:hypothetical protein